MAGHAGPGIYRATTALTLDALAFDLAMEAARAESARGR